MKLKRKYPIVITKVRGSLVFRCGIEQHVVTTTVIPSADDSFILYGLRRLLEQLNENPK